MKGAKPKTPASDRLEKAIMRRKIKLGLLKEEDMVPNDGLLPVKKKEKENG